MEREINTETVLNSDWLKARRETFEQLKRRYEKEEENYIELIEVKFLLETRLIEQLIKILVIGLNIEENIILQTEIDFCF